MQGYAPVPQNQYQPPIPPGGYPQPVVVGYNSTQVPPQYPNPPVPQVALPPQPYFGGIQYVYVQDPMVELGNSTGVLIRQQPQLLEQFTGCESPNRYYVFSQSPQGGMKLLFKCREHSGCCMRQCCPANAREFNMDIKHIIDGNMLLDDNFSAPFVRVNKPFKCTCFCLERPEMQVTFGESSQPCGRIKQPFSCCDPIFQINDNTGAMRYIIHGECCQCGLCCSNNFCGKLSEVLFNIYQTEDRTAPCGSIIKKSATGAELVTSADSYQVNFPQGATPQDKLLLIIAGLMIDYQYFEESASGKNNNSHTYHRGIHHGF